jgi:hypothetical protein
VSLDDETGYTADNQRFFVADPPPPLPVLLVTGVDGSRESALYVEAALDAAQGGRGRFAVTAVGADDPGLADAGVLDATKAIVLVGTRGLGRAARVALADWVRRGRGLVLVAGPDTEPGVVRELLGEAGRQIAEAGQPAGPLTLTATDVRHPVLAALGETAGNLGQVRVERAWTLRDLSAARTLVRYSSGHPAVVEFEVERGRVVLVTTDVGRRWNTWPLHPTFVPFVVEVVRHVSGERALWRDVLVGTLSLGAGEAGERPGIVTLPEAGRVAVNVDPRESRIDVLAPEALAARLERLAGTASIEARDADAEQGQALWRYGLMALLVLLGWEAVVAARPGRDGRVVSVDAPAIQSMSGEQGS